MSGVKKGSSIRAWFERNWKKYPDKASRMDACKKETGKSIKTIENVYWDNYKRLDLQFLSNNGKVASGITEDQLRAKHDVLFMIKQGVKKLAPGVYPTESEYLRDYVKVVGKSGVKSILELPEFKPYRGRAGGIVYWGAKESIKRMIDDHVLQEM